MRLLTVLAIAVLVFPAAAQNVYFSRDGGQTWTLDVTTNAEMSSCDSKRSGTHLQVWCAGYDGNFNGVVYGLSK